MNWNRQIHHPNISAWPHWQSKRGGSYSRSKDPWFWNYKFNKHIWAWGLDVLTLLAMECLLKTSSSLKVTNNPLSYTLRPVIPQQIHNHSLSFKPHKAGVEVKARRLESDLCFFVGIKMRLFGEITKSQVVILQCWVVLLRNCGKTLSGEGVRLLWYSQGCVTNPAVTWGEARQACNVIDVWDRWCVRSDKHSKTKGFGSRIIIFFKLWQLQLINYTKRNLKMCGINTNYWADNSKTKLFQLISALSGGPGTNVCYLFQFKRTASIVHNT